MVEEVLTEVVEVEAAGLEAAEDLDGVAAEVVIIGSKISVHQNMLSVSSRTKWRVDFCVSLLIYDRCTRKWMLCSKL